MMMLALAVVVAPRASASSGASQIALSCQGPGSFSASTNANTCAGVTSCPSSLTTLGAVFCISNIGGFWIWCETPSASNHYKGECNGALYQAEFTSGVFSYQVTSVKGDATGLSVPFMVAVGPSGSTECTFTVSPPLPSGQSNTIPAVCIGALTFTSAGPTTTGALTAGVGSSGIVGVAPGFTGAFSPGVAVLT